MKTKNNYYYEVADWWASKIKEEEKGYVKNIVPFTELLEQKINTTVSKSAHMVISTYRTRSQILGEIAFKTGMVAHIQKGFEMIISHNVGALVYDDKGIVVASFS